MNLNEFRQFLNVWDNSSTNSRVAILKKVIAENKGKTLPELEIAFANVPNLFFSRLLAWWRVTYLTCYVPCVQLKAISIFVCASGRNIFLTELVDIGGISTLLEILSLKNEVRKFESLSLLTTVANAGRKYKEVICESHGLQALTTCLGTSTNQQCHVACHALLKDLSTGNSKYEKKIFKTMIFLLKSSSLDAQITAAQILQHMQPTTVSKRVIDPCLNLLGSINLRVQYEVCNLVKFLMSYESIQDDFLLKIISLLKPDVKITNRSVATPLLVQQATKIIGMLAKDSPKIAEKLLKFGVIDGLLNVLHDKHFEGQKHAAETLKHLIQNFEEVKISLSESLDPAVYDTIRSLSL